MPRTTLPVVDAQRNKRSSSFVELKDGVIDTGKLAADAVTNAKLANMANKTYKGRTTAGTGDPEDVAVATLAVDLVEVGDWTPIILGTTTAGSNTYGTRAGRYMKFGPIVFAFFRVTLTAKDGAMTGNIRIGDLPFTVRNTSGLLGYGGNIHFLDSLATNVVHLAIRPITNTTQAGLLKMAAAAGTFATVVAADIGSTTGVAGYCIYEAA